MIDDVIEKAKGLPYIKGQRRIYSVIVDKKGRVLAEGKNSYSKTHPLQAYYAERADLEDKIYLHAEMSALVKLRSNEAYKIYVARVDSEGNPMLAAPCPICQIALKEAGITSVEHTI